MEAMRSLAQGWLVEVALPQLWLGNSEGLLFAVADEDPQSAVDLVRAKLGNLHCVIAAKIKLSQRALEQLGLTSGQAKQVPM